MKNIRKLKINRQIQRTLDQRSSEMEQKKLREMGVCDYKGDFEIEGQKRDSSL